MTTILVEVDVEFEGRTLAEVEAAVMGSLRRQVAPAIQGALGDLVSKVGVPPCPRCGRPRRSRGVEPRR